MTQVVTPSAKAMTDGQLEKAVDTFRAALRKQRSDFSSDAVQQVLGVENLGTELLAPFRARVEAVSGLVLRSVAVNRARTPEQMLEATGRRQYVEKDVVKAMPNGDGEQANVQFFTLGRYVTDDELEKEYDLRGLKPADPYALGAVNEADPAFADERPNATHWKDSKGKWCYAAFDRWRDGGRHVHVHRGGDDRWLDCWWFAGAGK